MWLSCTIFSFNVSLCDSLLSWCVQNNLVAKRGLGSDSDDQVYEVAFTDSFRKYFNSILLSSTSDVRTYMRMICSFIHIATYVRMYVVYMYCDCMQSLPFCGLQDKGQQGSKSEWVGQSRLMAYTKMNRFLSSFIEKVCWTTVGGQGGVLVKGKEECWRRARGECW